MHFLERDVAANDFLEKSCYYNYKGNTINVTDMNPIKIINGKVLTLPKPEKMIYSVDPIMKGSLRSFGGIEKIGASWSGSGFVSDLPVKDGSLMVEKISDRSGQKDYVTPTDEETSFTWTIKFKEFFNVNFRSLAIDTCIAQYQDNFIYITFKNKRELELVRRLWSDMQSGIQPMGCKTFLFSIPEDEFFNVTETYNKITGDYKLFINGVLKHSVTVSPSVGGHNVMLSIHGDGNAFLGRYTWDGNINNVMQSHKEFNNENDVQFTYYLRGFRKYDCLLTENDIKAIMRYDGII